MRQAADELLLSATDLANHLACRHVTTLEHGAALGHVSRPFWTDPAAEVLQERGMEHERAYLEHLAQLGHSVYEASAEAGQEATLAAMRAGRDVISQAILGKGRWHGRADVLLKVDAASDLGDWSYQVVDAKLARETKAGSVLQLCVYTELVEGIQGRRPERMHVVRPGVDFALETFPSCDYLAYYRLVKRGLEEAVASYDPKVTYPEPNPHCQICRWWPECDARWRADDHLYLVAGISKLQRRELEEGWGVGTLAGLALLPLPLTHRPARGAPERYIRVREQARVQLEGRTAGLPVHELLEREEGRGLYRLPQPSPGDLFFDIEGDHFAEEGGFEYLMAFVELEAAGKPLYRKRWAVNRGEERAAFEWFVDTVMARWADYPGMHIFHFAPYEPAALKRLMGRYASREEEVDRMLRAGLFVDLHRVVKESLRASVERYSIKDLEVFYDFTREADLREASRHLHGFERALELRRVADVSPETLALIEAYNRDDCRSLVFLRAWLEELRQGLVESGEEISRPEVEDGAPSEARTEAQQQMDALKARLTEGIGDEPADWTPGERGRWLTAAMLEWHWREEKAAWWEYFRLRDLPEEEYLYEKAALSGLDFLGRTGGKDATPVHRYHYPEQDVDIREGDTPYVGDKSIGAVFAIDPRSLTIDIRKKKTCADLHPKALFVHDVVRSDCLRDSLRRLGEWVADHGIDAEADQYRVARELLLKRPPRLAADSALSVSGEETLAQARRLGLALDRGVLPVQGPPGAGKTYTGARMALDLVRAGRKVGVTAVSHKAIRNLLEAIEAAALEAGTQVRCLQKVSDKPAEPTRMITQIKDNAEVAQVLADGETDVAAGTAWLWSREDMAEAVDVLFVDEAGQMSLANTLAAAQGAKSLVFLGDPQQLEQPLQGGHPEGAEASVLQHLLGKHQTMPPDRGLFLSETYRLHPAITSFTSELFYEGRLRSVGGLEVQRVLGEPPFTGAGLRFVSVDHEGNQNSSPEEAAALADLLEPVRRGDVRWTDKNGAERSLTLDDILVVAPYNAQVGEIGRSFEGCRVGTVDKFQGQEAPVAVYSMATSTPEEAPRGMEFLYSLNRLNVATSRAQASCVIIASPRLFQPDCQTPRQMQLANAFCRYLEMAEVVDFAAM
ncbi:MAG: TM0106 family RecB-like putative nuclease [Thermoleophilia bacterium]